MAKIQTPQPVRGTQDIQGDAAAAFQSVVDSFDRIRRLYGYQRIELPVIEPTAVFARTLGETTDIVGKEMYTFDDRGGDSITLRPEFTAGIARAYITNGWQQHAPMKVVTHGPLFRYERPQKGRYRQFHQLDAEVLGAAEPAADVELLCFADHLIRDLGIADGITLNLNTLGDSISREAWRNALVDHFAGGRDQLSRDSLDRLDRNPLRILDSKDAGDRALCDTAPRIDDYLTDEAGQFFEAVTAGLDAAGVAWTRNPALVRGMDYYRHTAFEFVTDRLGAQGTVLGGGRYDGLIASMGGPATAAVGWAAGIERLAMMIDPPAQPEPLVAIIPLGAAAETHALGLAADLRRAGHIVEMAYKGAIKKRMARANDLGAQYALILGDDELASGAATLKDLRDGSQQLVPLAGVATALATRA